MSDPEDKIDQYRDTALNKLVETIENTGGLEYADIDGLGHRLVPRGDTESEWSDLADAYLSACRALKIAPLICGKRAPRIRKITVQLERRVSDEIGDEENEAETVAVHEIFDGLPEDLEVAVVDRDGTYLYDAHREV